jgi:hypothetical protein
MFSEVSQNNLIIFSVNSRFSFNLSIDFEKSELSVNWRLPSMDSLNKFSMPLCAAECPDG